MDYRLYTISNIGNWSTVKWRTRVWLELDLERMTHALAACLGPILRRCQSVHFALKDGVK